MSSPMPVGVSGPGAMSQRTDQQPMRAVTGLPYGEGQALMQQQGAAPMAQTPRSAPAAIPMGAPTQSPGQPVTAGAAMGAGPGPEALTARPGAPAAQGAITQALSRAAASDTSGLFAQLLTVAQQKGL